MMRGEKSTLKPEHHSLTHTNVYSSMTYNTDDEEDAANKLLPLLPDNDVRVETRAVI
ncbi:hypothetical protein JOB18_039262 [Solea senegalensis]|uniref:Uncharacterized protein n=1 Tax=Solea senegalensis TaxID=28829 RepID=A0AAV6SI10_SOLSE|nr:hypothetical protein JOB18_039262 [Solea senegalensis]